MGGWTDQGLLILESCTPGYQHDVRELFGLVSESELAVAKDDEGVT